MGFQIMEPWQILLLFFFCVFLRFRFRRISPLCLYDRSPRWMAWVEHLPDSCVKKCMYTRSLRSCITYMYARCEIYRLDAALHKIWFTITATATVCVHECIHLLTKNMILKESFTQWCFVDESIDARKELIHGKNRVANLSNCIFFYRIFIWLKNGKTSWRKSIYSRYK